MLLLPMVVSLVQLCTAQQTYDEVIRIPLSSFVGTNKIEYGCVAVPLKPSEYIVEYQPIVQPNDVHHMAMYVCEEPYERNHVWECIDPKHVCKSRKKKEGLFAWTNGAPGWTLPAFAGVYTGNMSRYLIYQVHGRSDITSQQAERYASMKLRIRTERPPYDAALGVYAISGFIPANSRNFTADVACSWDLDVRAPLIAYGLHTHLYGIATSAFIIRNGTWIELGRVNPKYPLVVYDISQKNMYVQPGDTVAVRCTYDNPGDKDVPFGFSHVDEMCNLFLHFGVPHRMLWQTKHKQCASNAQEYHWDDHFSNIPSTSTDISGNTDQSRYIKRYNLKPMY